nr:SDR family NAD(P)-dependent oxidoreductase [uncultured Roseovarius sp.]
MLKIPCIGWQRISCRTSDPQETPLSKTILIIGATDSIGLSTAKTLAEPGHTVLLYDRSADKLEAATKGVGGAPETYRADLSRLHGVETLGEEIRTRHDRINVLINRCDDLEQVLITPRSSPLQPQEFHHASQIPNKRRRKRRLLDQSPRFRQAVPMARLLLAPH